MLIREICAIRGSSDAEFGLNANSRISTMASFRWVAARLLLGVIAITAKPSTGPAPTFLTPTGEGNLGQRDSFSVRP